jgi:predicted nucleotide-binding protein
MKAGIVQLNRRIADLEAFDPRSVQGSDDPKVKALEVAIDEALTNVFGNGTVEYNRYREAAALDHGVRMLDVTPSWIAARGGQSGGYHENLHEVHQDLTDAKSLSLVLLRQAARGLEERIADQEAAAPAPLAPAPRPRSSRKVFVVHGHDEAALQAVARFLEQIELEAIILREQPDAGRTIIEKFEDCAGEVGFAVVLLTPDDLASGGGSASAPAARARQNVIFELGYFAGKLGRGRACLLRKGDVDIPSDLYGVIYTELDAAEGWKIKLIRELKAANLEFDANKVWSP